MWNTQIAPCVAKAGVAASIVLGSLGLAGAAGVVGGTYQDSKNEACADCSTLVVNFGLTPNPSGVIVQTITCKTAAASPSPFSVELSQSTANSAVLPLLVNTAGMQGSTSYWVVTATNLHYGVTQATKPRITMNWAGNAFRQAQCGLTGIKN